MNEYELVVIIHPDLDDEAIEQALSRIDGWIKDGGGKIDTTDIWGKKRWLMRSRSRMKEYTIF